METCESIIIVAICTVYYTFNAAAQMWNLATYLPLMIGDRGDKFGECYLTLLEIMKVCTSQRTSEPAALYLSTLISDHHQMFRSCYPSVNLTPKFHYMIHFPRILTTYVTCMTITIIISVY